MTDLEQDLRELLLALVAVDSQNPSLAPGASGEGAVADLVTGWAARAGLGVERIEPTPGRPSLLITAPGTAPAGAPGLLLCGHLDTVGIGDAGLAPRVTGDRVHGRGAYDMKGGLAAALVAMREAVRRGAPGGVVLAAVADEEYASLGIRDVLDAHAARDPGRPIAGAAIVLEPTELAVVVAHRGFAWIEVTVDGLAAHGSRPHLGVDAITRMAPVITALDARNTELRAAEHPLLGPGFLHASTITGGTEPSTIPGRCTLVVERRTIPGETVADVEREVGRVLAACRAADPALRVSARTLLDRPPLETDPAHPFVRRVRDATRHATGTESPVEGASYWADSALIAATGVPTILYGPAGEGAHAAAEWVSFSSTVACARTILHVLGQPSGADR
jgi:acetylornithine deacetylase